MRPVVLFLLLLLLVCSAVAQQPTTPGELYFGTNPNYANSPLPQVTWTNGTPTVTGGGIRKFIDPLPMIGCPTSSAGVKCIPLAVPDTITFPGSDYYEISLVQYTEKLHSDLPATTLRGYIQTNHGTDASGHNTVAPQDVAHYLGPIIVANGNRPVRVKFTNALPGGAAGNLFIPVDLTAMGAGTNDSGQAYLENRATLHLHGGNTPWISDGTPHQWTIPAADWKSVAQPAFGGDNYNRGVSAQLVPDMFFDANGNVVYVPQCGGAVTTNCWPTAVPAGLSNDPGKGSLTFYYTNQQSARLMFYHDHAYGLTRLNVYAGEAAGYVLTDAAEQDLINGTNTSGANPTLARALPDLGIPLVIQDKTFVPGNPVSAPLYGVELLEVGAGYSPASTTVTFTGGACATPPTATAQIGTFVDPYGTLIDGAITGINLVNSGSCSVAPDVVITDSAAGGGTGAVAYAYLATLLSQDPTWIGHFGTGRPDTINGNGDLWFPHVYMTNQWPNNPDGSGVNPMGRWDYASWFWPPFNNNTYQVRGPIPCDPVNAPNTLDCPGFASTLTPATAGQGVGSIVTQVPESFMDTMVVNGEAYPTLTVPPQAVRFRILNAGNDRTINLSLFMACDVPGQYTPLSTATCPTAPAGATGLATGTEVGMVPSAPTAGFPSWWPTDGRDGGVPDPAAMGPSWIQVGNETGFLSAPAVIPPTPINYEYARRSVTVLNVSTKGLMLGPAERADVVVDFSAYAGKTLILYNDAPAPIPGFDPRLDYYTGDADQAATGGSPSTLAGFGPNTRTVMQIKVGTTPTAGALSSGTLLSNLKAVIPGVFKATQPTIIVPQAVYSNVYGQTLTDTFTTLQDYTKTFTPIGGKTPVTLTLLDKTIQELFELNYGKMNATLGVELPFTNFNTQTTIPLGYVDPPTEIIRDSSDVISQPVGVLGDGTQIWKVTHNGVDTHSIHFHLFNVQLIDRYGWDGTLRAPDANERGWKEVVRMNPLEIDFVALRPVKQTLPFSIPESIHSFDVTKPDGVVDLDMSNVDPTGGAASQINAKYNFGYEYIWHCHLLGHEENDMMRTIAFQVAPEAPTNLAALQTTYTSAVVQFTNNAAAVVQPNAPSGSTGYTVQRDTTNAFTNPVTLPTVAPTLGSTLGSTVSVTDNTLTAGVTYYYRAQAFTPNGVSAWSNSAQAVGAPIATLSPTSLSFGSVLVGGTLPARTITLSNTGLGPLTNIAVSITGDFAQTNNCPASLAVTASCTISVTFLPTASGNRTGQVTVASSDPANPTVSATLTGVGIGAAVISSPIPGSTLASTSVTFTWNAVAGAQYQLNAGSAPGGTNYYNSGHISTTSTTATNLPPDGSTVYVQLWTNLNGIWVVNNYTYTATNRLSVLTTPTPSSTLTSATVTFRWSTGTGVTQYTLDLGSTLGGAQYYSSGHVTTRNATVTNMPLNGSTVYARLWSLIGTTWYYRDYTYTAATAAPAAITSPAAGSTLTASSQAFIWNAGVGTTGQYQLNVGTAPGLTNIYNSGHIGATTATATNLPVDGSTLYVQLWSAMSSGSWAVINYTYTAANLKAALTSPVAGSTLTGSSATFNWSAGTGVTQYTLDVGSTPGGVQYFTTGHVATLTATTTNLPLDGSTIYVRLYSLIGTTWVYTDYTFTAATATAAVISTPAGGSTLTGVSQAFTWTAGVAVTQYQLNAGSAPGLTNYYNSGHITATTATASGLPADGTPVYVQLWSLMPSGSWVVNNYTYTGANLKAVLTTPAPGSTLAGATATFNWTAGAATQFTLDVGSTLGGTQYYSSGHVTAQTATVSGLPVTGGTVYVRLWSLVGGTWYYTDYTYTAF